MHDVRALAAISAGASPSGRGAACTAGMVSSRAMPAVAIARSVFRIRGFIKAVGDIVICAVMSIG